MRFRKNVPQENREVLMEQLKQYRREMKMTKEERRELEKWVASGRSPYENGDYVYSDYGYPMDFVSAMRALQELRPDLSEEGTEPEICCEYDTAADDVIFYRPQSSFEPDPDEELPFS